MKTLKEFMAKRKYVAVQYDKESQRKLREWSFKNGFNLSIDYKGEEQDPKAFDFHTTIFYSSNEVFLPNKTVSLPSTPVKITGVKFLGEEKNIPVLGLEVEGGIQQLRKQYEKLGLEDKWPSYQPHISLSYAKERVDTSNLKLPDFTPKFDKLIIRDIEE